MSVLDLLYIPHFPYPPYQKGVQIEALHRWLPIHSPLADRLRDLHCWADADLALSQFHQIRPQQHGVGWDEEL